TPPIVKALRISLLRTVDGLGRRPGVRAAADHHQFLQLCRGVVGEEKYRLRKGVYKRGRTRKARELALQGRRWGVDTNGSFAFEVGRQDVTRHRLRKGQMAVLKIERGGLALPRYVF